MISFTLMLAAHDANKSFKCGTTADTKLTDLWIYGFTVLPIPCSTIKMLRRRIITI